MKLKSRDMLFHVVPGRHHYCVLMFPLNHKLKPKANGRFFLGLPLLLLWVKAK